VRPKAKTAISLSGVGQSHFVIRRLPDRLLFDFDSLTCDGTIVFQHQAAREFLLGLRDHNPVVHRDEPNASLNQLQKNRNENVALKPHERQPSPCVGILLEQGNMTEDDFFHSPPPY
jgi:hypothetical protein